jgi:hypothetical protein
LPITADEGVVVEVGAGVVDVDAAGGAEDAVWLHAVLQATRRRTRAMLPKRISLD